MYVANINVDSLDEFTLANILMSEENIPYETDL